LSLKPAALRAVYNSQLPVVAISVAFLLGVVVVVVVVCVLSVAVGGRPVIATVSTPAQSPELLTFAFGSNLKEIRHFP
jgi:hypothetical protein